MVHRGAAVHAAWVALGFVWPVSTLAYRPFNSTDAAVAEEGEMEIELGPLGFVKEGSNRSLVAPGIIFNWGFAHGWELVLEGRHFIQLGDHITTERFRVEDAALSLKSVWREGTLQEKTGPSVATEFSVLLPILDGDDTGMGAEDAVIVSQRWADLTIHVNAAAAWTRAHRPGFFGGTIFEVHDTWAWRPVAEVFVEAERGVPTIVSGLIGAIGRVREALSFDVGLRVAQAGGVNTTEVRAGLTWAFRVGVPR